MSIVQRIATIILTLSLAAAVGVGAWWLATHKPTVPTSEKPTPPAMVTKVVKEDELNTVALTEEAEKRIGLAVGAVESKSIRRVRMYGGDVTIPVGRTILVTTPLGGTLKAPPGGEIKAGQTVKAGQVLFQLIPLLTPDGRANLSASLADAEGQVNNAKTQVDLTRIAFERAKKVLKNEAGSQKQVDEAEAAFNLATKSLEAATARNTILKKVIGDSDAGTVAPITIEAPENGILRTVSALAGQTLPSGAALFEVVDLSTVWVRVPLPVTDLEGIDRAGMANVGSLSSRSAAKLVSAKPINAPPSANALAATIDLFYELPNSDGTLTPGQRLGVTIPLAESADRTTVPWSAVVFDIHGGTWVYESIGSRKYARRRVVVAYTFGADAVLANGPAAGTKIVTAGVQELFGAETGFVK